jgi:hypothetical protein
VIPGSFLLHYSTATGEANRKRFALKSLEERSGTERSNIILQVDETVSVPVVCSMLLCSEMVCWEKSRLHSFWRQLVLGGGVRAMTAFALPPDCYCAKQCHLLPAFNSIYGYTLRSTPSSHRKILMTTDQLRYYPTLEQRLSKRPNRCRAATTAACSFHPRDSLF